MRNLIRKILNEHLKVNDKTPQWVIHFHSLDDRDDRIKFIEDYKKRIQKLLPTIISFYNLKYKDHLKKIVVDEKPVHMGNESYKFDKIHISFYFKSLPQDSYSTLQTRKTKSDIYKDLDSYFNIDISYYGVPLDMDFYLVGYDSDKNAIRF